MNPQRFCDQGAIDEVYSSVAAIRSLAYNVLCDREEGPTRSTTKGHFHTILAHTSRIFALLGESTKANALTTTTPVSLPNPSPTYRVMEEVTRQDGSATETAMVLARPSVLQLVTETVPAIDLENRHQLMRAVFEIVKRSDPPETDSPTTALQTQNHTRSTPAPVVNLPSSSDTRNLRNLFVTPSQRVEQ